MPNGFRVVLTLLRVADYKVVIVTVLFGALGVACLLSQRMYLFAATFGLSLALVSCAVYLPPRPVWRRALVVSLAGGTIAWISFLHPSYVLFTVLFSAIAGSFFAIRLAPSAGLIFFFAELLAALYPIYETWNTRPLLTTLFMLGGCVILSLQTYEVALKFHQYRRLSTFDELTGLHNVRYFRYKLNEYYADAKTTKLCLLLVDLDRFKAVNDILGHRVGDEVLKRAANLLQQEAAPAVVSRYGGEEFAIILPDADLDDAVALAERLRQVMESARLCGVPVTLSCGIAGTDLSSPDTAMDATALFDAADRALYLAKRCRNCIRVYNEGLCQEEAAITAKEPVSS
jgi:diguanylate cyclase (GGDEF)-like protein